MAFFTNGWVRHVFKRKHLRIFAIWAAVVVLTAFFFGEDIQKELHSRYQNWQDDQLRAKQREQELLKSLEIVYRLRFFGQCNQPGMVFKFDVSGELIVYASGRVLDLGQVEPGQKIFDQYRYKPPDSISLKLEKWIESGRPLGRVVLAATGEYEIEVNVDVSGDDDETRTVTETARHEVELDCDISIVSN